MATLVKIGEYWVAPEAVEAIDRHFTGSRVATRVLLRGGGAVLFSDSPDTIARALAEAGEPQEWRGVQRD